MHISLDYDNTYTRDPETWDKFVSLMTGAGHKVTCVTMRYDHEAVKMTIPVIYTGRKAKREFCQSKGVEIDVWIDDTPDFIVFSALA